MDPLYKSAAVEFASSQFQNNGFLLIDCCIDFKTVEVKENFHSCVPNTLIPIYEWVIQN